jgi:hypothetical protein
VLGKHRNFGCACVMSVTLAVLTVSCAFSPVSAGASSTSTSVPGITKSTITVGHIADISGPIPGLMAGSQD